MKFPRPPAALALVALASLLASSPSGAVSPEIADPREGNPWFESGRREAAEAWERIGLPPDLRTRNVILFIGDGMSITTVTAARILDGQRHGTSGEENALSFERLPFTALSKTYNTNQQVPDSAGTMSAMVTGVKTKAGVLSLDDTLNPANLATVAGARVPTLFEEAETHGLATGVVTTTTLTHATPGACYAHSPTRDWENDAWRTPEARAADFPDIARQLLEFPMGDGLEVALGGGRLNFLPSSTRDPEHRGVKGLREDGRDLTAEWLAGRKGSAYVWNASELAALDVAGTTRVLGLFEPSHMQWEADRAADPAGEPSIAEMTRLAIRMLAKDPEGFVLMVEGGRIDHGHHAGNAYRALTDTIAFAEAVQVALDETSEHDTLVVVTADHGHVFTMGGYATRGNDILGLVVHNERATGLPQPTPTHDLLGLPYTTLGYANGPGYTGASPLQREGAKTFPHKLPRSGSRTSPITEGRPDLSATDTTSPLYLQESTVPLPSETHSGEDVAIYAGGPGAAIFHGVREQSYIYHAVVEALGWRRASAAQARKSVPIEGESAP